MNDQVIPVPDDTDPAVHFTETLESIVERRQNATIGTAHDGWYSGMPVAVSHGVLVLDNERKGQRLHIRIADVHTIREYLPSGDPA
jgi:hypothetical protein